jgi:hypothetical protein
MDIDIAPKVLHDQIPGIHFIAEHHAEPGPGALRLQVSREQELPILPISVKVTGSHLSTLIAKDLGIDRISFHVNPGAKRSRNPEKPLNSLGFPAATESLYLREPLQACFSEAVKMSLLKQLLGCCCCCLFWEKSPGFSSVIVLPCVTLLDGDSVSL